MPFFHRDGLLEIDRLSNSLQLHVMGPRGCYRWTLPLASELFSPLAEALREHRPLSWQGEAGDLVAVSGPGGAALRWRRRDWLLGDSVTLHLDPLQASELAETMAPQPSAALGSLVR